MRRFLATATLSAACIVPILVIPLDALAFDFVSAMAALCLSPVAVMAAIAVTGAMNDRPTARAPLAA